MFTFANTLNVEEFSNEAEARFATIAFEKMELVAKTSAMPRLTTDPNVVVDDKDEIEVAPL